MKVPNLIPNLQFPFKFCIVFLQKLIVLPDHNYQALFVVSAYGVTSNSYKSSPVFSSSIFLFRFYIYIFYCPSGIHLIFTVN